MKMITRLKKILVGMLKENTGSHMLDSGGAYGRNWERNQAKDFDKLPEVTAVIEKCSDGSYDVNVTVSLYNFLKSRLELDTVCDEFNKKFKVMKDWDAEDIYGCSKEAEAFIKEKFEVKDCINTYNGESDLSQIIQYTMLREKFAVDDYVFLQIHNGCDARGGYTDGKLFKMSYDTGLWEDCTYGFLTRADGSSIKVDHETGSCRLASGDNGSKVEIKEGDKVELNLRTF